MNISSARAGTVCSIAIAESSSWPVRRWRAATMPIGMPSTIATPTEISTRTRWSSVSAASSASIARWRPAPSRAARAQEHRGHLGDAPAVQIRHRVQARHLRAVEPALERLAQPRPGARVALGHLPARQEHRGVVREEAPVVVEQPQLQALELAVGGEDVHDVHLPARDRAIGERVLHHLRPGQRQAVARAQTGPAVLALEKARAERGAQLRVPGQVADGPEPEALRQVGADRERVRVGEAERAADREPDRHRGARGWPPASRASRPSGGRARACRCTPDRGRSRRIRAPDR